MGSSNHQLSRRVEHAHLPTHNTIYVSTPDLWLSRGWPILWAHDLHFSRWPDISSLDTTILFIGILLDLWLVGGWHHSFFFTIEASVLPSDLWDLNGPLDCTSGSLVPAKIPHLLPPDQSRKVKIRPLQLEVFMPKVLIYKGTILSKLFYKVKAFLLRWSDINPGLQW